MVEQLSSRNFQDYFGRMGLTPNELEGEVSILEPEVHRVVGHLGNVDSFDLTPEQRDAKYPTEPRRINPLRPISRDILSDDLASDPEIIHVDRRWFEISRNGRTLRVHIQNHGTYLNAHTYLIQTARAPGEKGLTTHLYAKALEIFRSAVNKRHVELNYQLVTSNDKMKKWAWSEKGGLGLFHWDRVWDIHPVEWMFIKTIEPETY